MNGSVPLEWWLCARPRPLVGLAFLLAAVIAVQHLLMFQADLAGAPVLHLPPAGLAIFWSLLMERSAHTKLTWAMAAVPIAFNVPALEHSLLPWRTTPSAAAVCRALGRELAKDPLPAFVSGLPDRLQVRPLSLQGISGMRRDELRATARTCMS